MYLNKTEFPVTLFNKFVNMNEFVDREIQTFEKLRWTEAFIMKELRIDATLSRSPQKKYIFSGYSHDYNFDLVILLSTMGLFVFLLVVEMLIELRLIKKYSRFQLPDECDFVTKVQIKKQYEAFHAFQSSIC